MKKKCDFVLAVEKSISYLCSALSLNPIIVELKILAS
jgi:hypothetical protein